MHVDDSTVANFRDWAYKVASTTMLPRGMDVDDVAQEAMLAIWRACQGHDDLPATYLTTSARRRLARLYVRPQAGSERGRGHRYNAIDRPVADVPERVHHPEMPDMAYYHHEIFDSLNGLPEHYRRYVFYRFWLDMNNKEAAEAMHVHRATGSTWWNESIKPALRSRLAALESVT